MSGDAIDLVAFDLASERRLGPARDGALTQRRGHRLDITAVEAQLLGDRVGGQVQSHEIQA
jgi:hypothetical protein